LDRDTLPQQQETPPTGVDTIKLQSTSSQSISGKKTILPADGLGTIWPTPPLLHPLSGEALDAQACNAT
jgi:hypothetical protein